MYRVRVWCPDCCGEDFQGCFEGGSEVLHEMKVEGGKFTYPDLLFPTKAEAEKAGGDYTSHSIWQYEIEEV